MNILHTSDWHLGHSLYGRRRDDEFESFLKTLLEIIRQNQVDVLLIAGDVFDSSTPSLTAQRMYYHFLADVRSTSCRHVVVIGGNHDSPSLLNAPRELLMALNVYVIGQVTENPEDEVLVLCDDAGKPQLIVGAVPYLRDQDVRIPQQGETPDQKTQALLEGIREHYARVGRAAEERRRQLNAEVPIVGMGHLFAQGGRTLGDDGIRELYVGNLVSVGADAFPACFAYTALGHLHLPQMVGGRETIRYSGSPLAMGFNEAGHQKAVYLIEFSGSQPRLSEIALPAFQRLKQVSGNLREIRHEIESLKTSGESVWVEVKYTGQEYHPDLRARVEEFCANSRVEVLRILSDLSPTGADFAAEVGEMRTVHDFEPETFFAYLLDSRKVAAEHREELQRTFREALYAVQSTTHAEGKNP